MCAAVLKYWREASNLLMVHTRTQIRHTVLPCQTCTGPCPPPPPCPPPTCVKKTRQCTPYNELELLMIKRTKRAGCLPDLCVFPGGTAHNVDFSSDWLKLFGATCPESAQIRFGFAKTVCKTAPMLYRLRDPEYSEVPSEVAFRICAVRETFQETGVLLARSADVATFQFNPNAVEAYSFGEEHIKNVEEWRLKVRKDPYEFIKLCKTLDIVPDIWSLYDWSNWLSPADACKADCKRLDAAFYVCCLTKCPYTSEDCNEMEMVRSHWLTGMQMFKDYNESLLHLTPTQLYETARLMNFNDVEELLQFMKRRAGQPVCRWMPVRIQCSDGILYVFPGDSLYPSQPDIDGVCPMLQRKETLEQLTYCSCALNRAVSRCSPCGKQLYQIQCNIKQHHGHVSPLLCKVK